MESLTKYRQHICSQLSQPVDGDSFGKEPMDRIISATRILHCPSHTSHATSDHVSPAALRASLGLGPRRSAATQDPPQRRRPCGVAVRARPPPPRHRRHRRPPLRASRSAAVPRPPRRPPPASACASATCASRARARARARGPPSWRLAAWHARRPRGPPAAGAGRSSRRQCPGSPPGSGSGSGPGSGWGWGWG
eukprot:scaffold10049_cov59-Phaeocystis_antarctica.AAC.2